MTTEALARLSRDELEEWIAARQDEARAALATYTACVDDIARGHRELRRRIEIAATTATS